MPYEVTDRFCHLWTDALHARELARQAANAWDRGSYARWAVIAAWSAFEATAADLLGVRSIGGRFRERFDEGRCTAGLGPAEWGSGLWQSVRQVYEWRNDYTHRNESQRVLFASVDRAEQTITVLRGAILRLHGECRRPAPGWAHYDKDDGWDNGRDAFAHGMVRHGVDRGDPGVVEIGYVLKGKEYVSDVWPAGVDPIQEAEQLVDTIRCPANKVFARQSGKILYERDLMIRGTWGTPGPIFETEE